MSLDNFKTKRRLVMLFSIYGKLLKVWLLSTISTVVLGLFDLFLMVFIVAVVIAGFVQLEIDLSEYLPSGWLVFGIPLALLAYGMVIALAKPVDVSLFITKKVGLLILWAPTTLLLLWFLGLFNPSWFENLHDYIEDILDDVDLSEIVGA
jgi:hypothetical protein